MEYRVALSDDARAEMDRLSPNTKRDVNEVIERLRSGADRDLDLHLTDVNLWRAKAGRRWRVIFEVLPGRQIMVRRIRRRREAYRGIEHPDQRDVGEPEWSYEPDEIYSPVVP